MDDQVINDFISAFDLDNVLALESFEKLGIYREFLNKRYAKFIERVDNNYFELSGNDKNSNYFLQKVIEKLNNHKDLLFVTENDITYYFYERSIIVIPIQKGNVHSEASNLQYYYLTKAIDHFTKQLSAAEIISSTKKNLQKEDIKREAYGFKIKNPTILLGAWRLLRNNENKFIPQDITYEVFLNNFTGKKIKKKIMWISSDRCLHYFIDGIYGNTKETYGLGVEIEEDGQWNKASDCFCKIDNSSYDHGNLSRTKNPSNKKQIDILNIIIGQMIKQPPKKKD